MEQKRIGLLGLLIGILASCQSLVQEVSLDDLPKSEAKLVMTGFICPQDTTIWVKLTESSPLFGEYKRRQTITIIGQDTLYSGESDTVPDALVTISDGSKTAQLTYDKTNELYSLPTTKFKIEAGKTYTLNSKTTNKQVSASCQVPSETVSLKTYSTDTTTATNLRNGQTKAITTTASWDDLKGKTNYYRIMGEVEIELLEPVSDKQKGVVYNTERRYLAFNWGNDAEAGYLSDIGLDGATFKSPQGKATYNVNTITVANKKYSTQQSSRPMVIRLDLLNVDYNYYQYLLSVRRQRRNNPFVEPSFVYSNVQGGLGCFAAYNRTRTEIKR
ncbi:MAG: DUF4249 domain-containing protein [Spirosomataceae bacterium]